MQELFRLPEAKKSYISLILVIIISAAYCYATQSNHWAVINDSDDNSTIGFYRYCNTNADSILFTNIGCNLFTESMLSQYCSLCNNQYNIPNCNNLICLELRLIRIGLLLCSSLIGLSAILLLLLQYYRYSIQTKYHYKLLSNTILITAVLSSLISSTIIGLSMDLFFAQFQLNLRIARDSIVFIISTIINYIAVFTIYQYNLLKSADNNSTKSDQIQGLLYDSMYDSMIR